MRDRWLVGSSFFLTAIMAAGLVSGQEEGRSRTLIDRFNSLRRGWTQQSGEPEPPPQQPSQPKVPGPLDLLFPSRADDAPVPIPTQNGSAAIGTSTNDWSSAALPAPSRFPQVNARDLLPLNIFRRGDSSPQANGSSSPAPTSRMGSVSHSLGGSPGAQQSADPVIGREALNARPQGPGESLHADLYSSSRPSPEAERHPTVPGADFPAASHESLGDPAMIIATDRGIPPGIAVPGGGPAPEVISGQGQNGPDTAGGAPSARKSPQAAGRFAFNADELRRDRSSSTTNAGIEDFHPQTRAGDDATGAESLPQAQLGSARGPLASDRQSDNQAPVVLEPEQEPLPGISAFDAGSLPVPPPAAASEPYRGEQSGESWSAVQSDSNSLDGASHLGNARRAFTELDDSTASARRPREGVGLPEGAQAWQRNAAGRPNSADSTGVSHGSLRSPAGDGALPSDSSGQLLVTRQTPQVSSKVTGPKQILVGREATYRIELRNGGEAPAGEVVAEIDVPSWAEIANASVSSGIVQRPTDASRPNALRWHISRLESQSTEYLDLNLIPHDSRPLELGITWSHAPVESRAIVEVQEPKLQMQVAGPEEVLFGQPQFYRLMLSNPGTGTAENVEITLMPPGGGSRAVSSHQIGSLSPGETKSIDVELTPRDAGKLVVLASATAAGGLTAEASKEVFCRKPELEVDWRGPESKYAGTEATYYFRVRNPGTAPAEDVEVSVVLPSGMEFLSASQGQSFDERRGEVRWQIGTLRPGDDFYMELRSIANTPGDNRLVVTAATADRELKDSVLAQTDVIALADLKLEVSDPPRPVPVGEEVVYEIRVRNRGMNTAQEVNIVALFSDGIEPHSAEGAQYSISDGCVSFRTIDNIPAEREITLRVRAKALQPGTHVFRAEVLCRDLEIKLAAEETTRFFQDDVLRTAEVPMNDGDLPDDGQRYQVAP